VFSQKEKTESVKEGKSSSLLNGTERIEIREISLRFRYLKMALERGAQRNKGHCRSQIVLM
jgi:hypothetical protein